VDGEEFHIEMMINYDHWSEVPRTWSAWPWQFFTPKEVACRGTGRLSISCNLMGKLDLLRSRFGSPLNISSAFRSPYHNAKVGGAPRSMHLFGLAADIPIVGKDKNLIKRLAKDLGFAGFGYYRTFMHIDLGRKREWGKWNDS
jgi:zinc D-Ala-D-Ala carboxypeptidase